MGHTVETTRGRPRSWSQSIGQEFRARQREAGPAYLSPRCPCRRCRGRAGRIRLRCQSFIGFPGAGTTDGIHRPCRDRRRCCCTLRSSWCRCGPRLAAADGPTGIGRRCGRRPSARHPKCPAGDPCVPAYLGRRRSSNGARGPGHRTSRCGEAVGRLPDVTAPVPQSEFTLRAAGQPAERVSRGLPFGAGLRGRLRHAGLCG